jgi:hypothetical protein
MQLNKEGPTILFWDRIQSLVRVKANGEHVTKGATDGSNIIRVNRGKRGGCFVTVFWTCQELLRSNVTCWPDNVSADGKQVDLLLVDFSQGRNGYQRMFKIRFFDEIGASRFFEIVTESLDCGDHSFIQMKIGETIIDTSQDTIDLLNEEEEVDVEEENNVEWGSKDGGGEDKGKSKGADKDKDEGELKGKDEDKEESEEEGDQDLDCNFGESQDLFNPTHVMF